MATYNGSEFVLRQLNSVIKQLGDNDEIIVVDDKSSDNTVTLIKEAYGHKVKVFINENNMGAIKSFEKAIKLATGDIIFLCDQDDIWEDYKVSLVVEAFQKGNAAVVVHDAYVVDGQLNIIDHSWNDYNQNKKKGILGNIIKNSFTGACMAFKKDLVPYFIPFPNSIEMHDQWIALVAMLEKKKVAYIDQPLMKYVRHGNNVTGVKKRSIRHMIKGRMGTIASVLGYKRN
ncbi:glycosyltransferase family 2 protein [Robertmurraya yapensis]|uniref:Glycosyltransferase family 2 protein n=2 Tax=Bacillus yapensis TaxID=2492960 RepID=A0A431WLS1_9BACI|nr:glycosyltransferase family 2 protein [Bacillus yapensis]TKT05943.1 glycosyltransferase [Bacillus yapensis]